ncbi:hypothetical protein GT568_14870 [Coprococcus sp. BIOML-A1]|uniref:hypothetical protein n=1 Tax=unclassified Coprococcus TaxID=2684943 RepID=UPI0013686568|nr:MULTISPECIES: hypothetical protein [unclassified Coprococcus]MZK40088.1 hypothetical protein [Coprococcus sp. BIOML-A1]MZK65101.1 hypothetical protein [Coprococcus sp. BIOML-A2]
MGIVFVNVPVCVLMDVYKGMCERAKELDGKIVDLIESPVEKFSAVRQLCYLLGQIDFIEVLIDGIYSKELLREIKGSLGSIDIIRYLG